MAGTDSLEGSGWDTDILGPGYTRRTLDLGKDPDGEGDVRAVVVRRDPGDGDTVGGAVLYLHGFSDYFFQTDLAEFFAARGQAFYALDLRKSGRARQPGQTAHYVSRLETYDEEIERTVELIIAEHGAIPILVLAHSTGGLIASLWLDRRRQRAGVDPIAGLVLNSPWFDLQGSAKMRGPLTWALRGLAPVLPLRRLSLPASTAYGDSLHVDGSGEWDYDLELKPRAGFPVTVGWLNAIRRGHARLHRGVNVGVPALVLHSAKTHFSRAYSAAADRADTVLDVAQIARWSGRLGIHTTVIPIDDARHDVFLSLPDVRERAYGHLDTWLDERTRVRFGAGEPR